MKKKVLVSLMILSMTAFVACGKEERTRGPHGDTKESAVVEETTDYVDNAKDARDEIDEMNAQIEEQIREAEEAAKPTTEPTAEPEVEETVDAEYAPPADYMNYKVQYIEQFSTHDLDGNAVTEDIFSESEYTMINIWGTFCGPCINEMPELQEIYEDLPDNIQMIGVICDVYDGDSYGVSDAIDIVDYTGVKYTNLKSCSALDNYFRNLQYVPTTVFVDSHGYVVCEVIEGADIDAYKRIINQLGR